MTLRTSVYIAALASLCACQPDPDQQMAQQYVTSLQPVLQENSLLAEQVLTSAADIYNGSGTTEDLAETWRHNTLPMAWHVVAHASAVAPPPGYGSRHSEIVEIWTHRGKAYLEISEALYTADEARFRAAMRASQQATLDEDRWFLKLNEALAPHELSVDAYP